MTLYVLYTDIVGLALQKRAQVMQRLRGLGAEDRHDDHHVW
jgi:hypothetical protein